MQPSQSVPKSTEGGETKKIPRKLSRFLTAEVRIVLPLFGGERARTLPLIGVVGFEVGAFCWLGGATTGGSGDAGFSLFVGGGGGGGTVATKAVGTACAFSWEGEAFIRL